MLMRFFLTLLSSVVLIAAFVACGGDDDDSAFQAGQLRCDGFGTKNYHYTMKVFEEVKPFEGPAPTPVNLTQPITVLWDITGANEGGDHGGSIDAKQYNEVSGTGGESETILLDNDEGYVDIGQGWRKVENPERPPNVPFWPIFTCRALAPDIDTTKLGPSESETINGVPSQKFSFAITDSDFLARHPDFGGGSHAGANIHAISGSIWVADKGNLMTKLDLSSEGQYPTGQEITVTMQFEVSDLDADIKVRAPI